MEKELLTARQKALQINLDSTIYGSFAEIGAGQEVARYFFLAGAASGTVAKTISAYDMSMSDSLYGDSGGRYVCEPRLHKMLDYEFTDLVTLLSEKRGDKTRFFAFADTVSALNYRKDNQAHGWMGVKFQLTPKSAPNEVVIHVKMLENDNILQQRTLGILGVNLIYACFYHYDRPNSFISSLLESLSSDRIEIDYIKMKGPELEYVDNRLLAVQLVKNGMTVATMFDRKGMVQPPADLLYKKNVMVLRGSFRPITYVGFDMLKCAFALFKRDEDYDKHNTIVLCEMTINNLLSEGELDERDFLDRVDVLCGMGQNVMISNFKEYYKLTTYFAQFKMKKLRLLLGVPNFLKVIDEKYYCNLKGGILEAFGHLFLSNLKIYLYPAINQENEELIPSRNLPVPDKLKGLYQYLLDNRIILDLKDVRKSSLHFFSHNVLKLMKEKNPEWETMVPKYVSNFIKARKLFGY